MRIRQIKIRNFRLLKNFSLDIEDELSLVIGKNNNMIVFGDEVGKDEYEKTLKAISLRLVIEYDKNDNLKNISQVMMDLNPDNSFVVLGFDWLLEHDQYKKFREGYSEFVNNELQSTARLYHVSLLPASWNSFLILTEPILHVTTKPSWWFTAT